MSDLALSDRRRLAELEDVVARGLGTFVEVGNALLEIRDSRLYEQTHLTFESYCNEKWAMGRSYANKLILAAQVGTTVPTATERQARELAPLLSQPATLREAWAEVVELHPEPTAQQVREVVQKHRPAPMQTEAERQAAAEKQHRWAATLNVLDGLQHFDRPAIPAQAEATARLIDPLVAATRGEAITPERLRRAAAWAALLADELERTINA